MELLELVTNLQTALKIDDLKDMPDKLLAIALTDDDAAKDAIVDAVGGDLSVDFLQAVYQYYSADRKDLKQDFTPKSLARLVSAMIGETDTCIDLCAGSGALTIQRHNLQPKWDFVCYEYDDNVIPYLLFNMVIRNISGVIYQGDVLTNGEQPKYRIERGERYGRVLNFESAI